MRHDKMLGGRGTCDRLPSPLRRGSNAVSGVIQEIPEEKTESITGQSYVKRNYQSLFSFHLTSLWLD